MECFIIGYGGFILPTQLSLGTSLERKETRPGETARAACLLNCHQALDFVGEVVSFLWPSGWQRWRDGLALAILKI